MPSSFGRKKDPLNSSGSRRWGRRRPDESPQGRSGSGNSNYLPPTVPLDNRNNESISDMSDIIADGGGDIVDSVAGASSYTADSNMPPGSTATTTASSSPFHNLTAGISTLFRRDRATSSVVSSSVFTTTTTGSSTNQHASTTRNTNTTKNNNDKKKNLLPRTPSSRLFYSDDVSSDDDSYQSRVSTMSQRRRDEEGDDDDEEDPTTATPAVKRYRGFSTSVKSLFLDESLVCAAMGCFGLLLSHRTEHLLQVRNDRRGGGEPTSPTSSTGRSNNRNAKPSNVLAIALLITWFLIATTFVVWGFGHGHYVDEFAEDETEEDYNPYDDDYYHDLYENGDDYDGYIYNYPNDDGTNRNNDNNNRWLHDTARTTTSDHHHDHKFHGICKLRDAQDLFWRPLLEFVRDEWDRSDDVKDDDWATMSDRALGTDDSSGSDSSSSYSSSSSTYSSSYNDDSSSSSSSSSYSSSYSSSSSSNNESNDKPEDDSSSSEQDWSNGNRDDGAIGAHIRTGLVLTFFIVLGVVGRRRRMRTRYAIARARAQEDHLYNASHLSKTQSTREDQYQGACGHTLLGCYPVDPPIEEVEEEEEFQVQDSANGFSLFGTKKKRQHGDCVSRGFSCLMAMCCGCVCKCWFQCMSICALAQEAREMRVLVPPKYQRIDFITLQPFSDYQKNVNDLRRGWLGKTRRKVGISPHWHALSQLSRIILVGFSCTFLAILLTLVFNPRASFSWNDAIVLTATFAQSFLVLYVVFWIFHKSDLSLDAVIKFFAAGFLMAAPAAFIFEGLLVNMILAISYWIYVVAEMIRGEAFGDWVVTHYRFIWMVGELINAYVVAAVTEELCKYYTFRSVEHPDLIFLTGLDRKAQDGSAVQGGLVNYPYGGHQVSELNRANSFGSEYSHRNIHSKRSKKHREGDDYSTSMRSAKTEDEFFEDESDARTFRQKAMAITTGMISVAVGLACAENFLYVFIFGGTASSGDGSGILQEWIVLFFRSVFPIHALSAAMQSINMIRKFVECGDDNSHRIGVGRIILPAVVLHGTFDAILLSINVYVESAWDDYREEHGDNVEEGVEPYNALVLNLVAWIGIIAIMLLGMIWYYRENRSQRLRLILLEEQDKAVSDIPYKSPKGAGKERQELELV